MVVPIVASAIFVLAVVVLCLAKPNAGRIFLGLFFLVMAIGVNVVMVLTNPQSYVEYGSGALIPLYRELTLNIIALSPALFGLLLAVFEIAMGLLILSKQGYVKIGLIGTIIFVVALTPVSVIQFPWLGLVVGQAYLLTKEFDTTFLEVLRSKLRPQQ